MNTHLVLVSSFLAFLIHNAKSRQDRHNLCFCISESTLAMSLTNVRAAVDAWYVVLDAALTLISD